MLYHHSEKDYQVAASEAARNAREKMETLIAKGTTRAGVVIQEVMTTQPVDRVIRGPALRFSPMQRNLGISSGTFAEPMHDHALTQVAQRADIPKGFIEALREPSRADWGVPLIAHNLNEIYSHSADKYLLRSVNATVMGFLSDRYRRMDSRPIVEAFATACQDIGAVPVEGYAMQTKIAIKALLPMVFEPVPNEVMCFGLMLKNSDFGDGALSLSGFVLRLWCTNFAIREEEGNFRKVHLGRRLDEQIIYSDQTYQLDTAAMASATRDVVRGQLAPPKVDEFLSMVRRANEEKIDPKKAMAELRSQVTKVEGQAIVEAFNSPDIEMLPPGNTKWRFSNAISWVANTEKSEARKLELMKIAGDVLS